MLLGPRRSCWSDIVDGVEVDNGFRRRRRRHLSGRVGGRWSGHLGGVTDVTPGGGRGSGCRSACDLDGVEDLDHPFAPCSVPVCEFDQPLHQATDLVVGCIHGGGDWWMGEIRWE